MTRRQIEVYSEGGGGGGDDREREVTNPKTTIYLLGGGAPACHTPSSMFVCLLVTTIGDTGFTLPLRGVIV